MGHGLAAARVAAFAVYSQPVAATPRPGLGEHMDERLRHWVRPRAVEIGDRTRPNATKHGQFGSREDRRKVPHLQGESGSGRLVYSYLPCRRSWVRVPSAAWRALQIAGFSHGWAGSLPVRSMPRAGRERPADRRERSGATCARCGPPSRASHLPPVGSHARPRGLDPAHAHEQVRRVSAQPRRGDHSRRRSRRHARAPRERLRLSFRRRRAASQHLPRLRGLARGGPRRLVRR
jgi:hypothetical protein